MNDPENEDRTMLTRRRVSRIFFNRKFFDYPISKINRAELWCDLYYRIIIDLDSDEET